MHVCDFPLFVLSCMGRILAMVQPRRPGNSTNFWLKRFRNLEAGAALGNVALLYHARRPFFFVNNILQDPTGNWTESKCKERRRSADRTVLLCFLMSAGKRRSYRPTFGSLELFFPKLSLLAGDGGGATGHSGQGSTLRHALRCRQVFQNNGWFICPPLPNAKNFLAFKYQT
jgi:hypothetical protein